jgi:glycerophosphoryl diester phosphodiesterase
VQHPFFKGSTPLVFAHRGASAVAPENTLAAFDRALAAGADGLELDVHLSRDGVVVVHHDSSLDRTTNAGGPVAGRTADELARLDAGFRFEQNGFHPFRGQGIGIVTLESVLSRYREVRIIVDMKVNSVELARGTVALVRAADAIDRVCLGSMGLRALQAARTADSAVATSASREEVRWALFRSWLRWPVGRASYQGLQVPEKTKVTRVVSPRFVDMIHRTGHAVQVWTVNEESDASRLLGWGVDGLITDRPDVIVPLRSG